MERITRSQKNMKLERLKKVVAIINYIIFLIVFIVLSDVILFRIILDYGYPRHYEEENFFRYPAPYIEFTGKPNSLDHNEFGFRGPSFKESDPDDLKIAFWGGSTGYQGNPPIPDIVKNELEKILGINVFVANYSIISSNHRQHLHGIIEYLPRFKPDIVIFYGGYNETLQSAYYDPRPGYPFNYFYRAETGPFIKILLKYSAIVGVIDKKYGIFSGMNKLRLEQQPLSDSWNKRIEEKYFETLELANNIVGTIESKYFGRAKFLAFYQPYKVPEEFQSTHEDIKNNIRTIKYIFDVSTEYDPLGNDVFVDTVHVNQYAKEMMGKKIAQIIANQLQLKRN